MSKEVKSKEKLIKKLTEKVQQLNEVEKLQDLVKDNKIEFEVNKINYRVSKPTGTQNKELRKARNGRFFELLKDPSFKLKEVLIKEIKEKGYDIIAKQEEIKEIDLQISDIQEKAAVIPTVSKEVLKDYERQVDELTKKQNQIAIRIAELMEFSIEQELLEFSNLYLIYNVLEKEEDKKWIKCFKTFEDFQNCSEEAIILEATYFMSMLVFRSKI